MNSFFATITGGDPWLHSRPSSASHPATSPRPTIRYVVLRISKARRGLPPIPRGLLKQPYKLRFSAQDAIKICFPPSTERFGKHKKALNLSPSQVPPTRKPTFDTTCKYFKIG